MRVLFSRISLKEYLATKWQERQALFAISRVFYFHEIYVFSASKNDTEHFRGNRTACFSLKRARHTTDLGSFVSRNKNNISKNNMSQVV